ncbi:hypothetical protein FBQ85_00305 [Cytophagia bacterium CHB2]|nr:hypothetical protein [Cytophagia bacterium CHB2]
MLSGRQENSKQKALLFITHQIFNFEIYQNFAGSQHQKLRSRNAPDTHFDTCFCKYSHQSVVEAGKFTAALASEPKLYAAKCRAGETRTAVSACTDSRYIVV